MSIIINGMEMPTGNNAVSIIIFPNGKVSLAHDHRFAEYAEAVPVPKHGRLIDADALVSKIQKALDAQGDSWLKSPVRMAERAMRVADFRQIKNAPTIIPASFENPTKNARYSQDNPAEEGE